VTGVALVVVAAGLLLTAIHTAHEAGWLNVGQAPALDLSWLVQPGSVLASLLTGVLGLEPHPTRIEVLGWLLYAIPVGVYVAWPQRRPRTPAAATAVTGAVVVAVLLVSACGGGSGSGASGTTLEVEVAKAGCRPAQASVPPATWPRPGSGTPRPAALAKAVDSVAEPLSKVAGIVVQYGGDR
jgi:high-affinity iron transporter